MHPLDNVIWEALSTRQAEFAESFDQARRFPHEVTTLTAFLEPSPRGYSSLAGLVPSGGVAVLSLNAPYEPQPGWDVVTSFLGLQMVWDGGYAEHTAAGTRGVSSLPPITKLGSADSPDMVELTRLTRPGPFGTRTHELGKYLGIRREGKLVAMAGERLKVPGYTEVSAVCTHPEHAGKGYARVLMVEIMREIRRRGETPFLHVKQDNTRAIELYQKLAFRTRMVVHFTVLKRLQS